MSSIDRKTVGLDDALVALKIREGGGSWAQVIEATGFNGATLRPYIARILKERLERAPVLRGDRVDSPYAIVEPVELTTESIVGARKRGMAWYSIANALGVSEAKCRKLGGPEASLRVYASRNGAVAATEATEEADDRPDAATILAVIGRATTEKACLAKFATEDEVKDEEEAAA